MEVLVLSLLILAGAAAWCILNDPAEANEKIVNDVQ